MSKYKYFRPYNHSKKYYTASGIVITLLLWFVLLSVDIIKYTFKYALKLIRWIKNTYHYRNINYNYDEIVSLIKNMSPREFEIFCGELFKYQGYDVELTEAGNDGGKDVILYSDDGKKIYVECKHYDSEFGGIVGREIVQKLVGAMTIDGADECIVITTGRINENAFECAEKYDNLMLLGFNDIMRMIACLDVHILPRIFMKTFNSEPENRLVFQ